ncbi:MAG: hypothetical protein NTZ12_03485, partial [Candidatus Aminicenantes bacterium]|nr:hypothetical protein [Candidatus Aminicenantes bacterium]
YDYCSCWSCSAVMVIEKALLWSFLRHIRRRSPMNHGVGRAGVPLTIVQQILGHANLNTTAVYLQFSGQEAKTILKDRGLI